MAEPLPSGMALVAVRPEGALPASIRRRIRLAGGASATSEC